MEQLNALADEVRKSLNINFDKNGVMYLEGFIERNKSQFSAEDLNGLINSCGAFLGCAIIENYGGKWVVDISGAYAVEFTEGNLVFPFSKVTKQVENGLEDSVYSLFTTIPVVFKLSPIKKKWWQF